jgi:uncharacterized repeat protein (TIGR01451 family)
MSKWITLVVLVLLAVFLWPSMSLQASSPPALGITPTPTSPPEPTPLPGATPTPGSPSGDDDEDGPDPVITKRGEPSEAMPGQEVTFTIEVTNRGRQAAVDVVVTDDVPEYLEIMEVTTTQGIVTVEGQRVTVEVGTVGPGYFVEIVIHTRVRSDTPALTVMENVAILKSPNGGERTTPPVIIDVPVPNLPQTGGIRPSSSGIAWVGAGIAVLALAVIGMGMARSKH